MVRFYIVFVLICALIPSHYAFAENDAEKVEKTPLTLWRDKEEAIQSSLSEDDLKIYYILRNKFGITRMVQITRDDIEKAVESCAANNANLAEDIQIRFDEWKRAVNPILKMSREYLQEEIDTQEILDPEEFQSAMKLNDAAFEYRESQINKVPISSEDDCKGLLASLDRNENELIEHLQDTLLPQSVILKRAEKYEEEQEKSE